MKRIGLFGGTFNPIHWGHLRSASEVKRGFPLDRCYLIPAAVPPHKSARGADTAARLEMIRLALAETDKPLHLCDIELKRPGPSYTIDTVVELQQCFCNDSRVHLILGIDAFVDIVSWKSYMTLLQRVAFIVVNRPGAASGDQASLKNRLSVFLESQISDGYRFESDRSCFAHPRLQPIFLQTVTPMAISSSIIRKRLQQGQSIRNLVPAAVEHYIRSKRLYA